MNTKFLASLYSSEPRLSFESEDKCYVVCFFSSYQCEAAVTLSTDAVTGSILDDYMLHMEKSAVYPAL
jgi:hypothetical protein